MGDSTNKWTEAEVAILRDRYPDMGAKGCAALLPGRAESAIYQRAFRYGLLSNKNRRRAKQLREAAGAALWPRCPKQIAADKALNQWGAATPAQNLSVRIAA